MAANDNNSRPVSFLTLALQQHAQQQPQQPQTRPRSRRFHSEEDFHQQTGHDIQQMRHGWAQQSIQSNTLTPFLHDLTHGGEDIVKQQGLVPKQMRNANIPVDPFASSNNNTDVFVAGPQVTKRFFGLGPLKQRSEFVHVVGQSHDFMPDSDYHEYVGKRISSNDSVQFTGAIPPLRDAQPGDTGPKSFMLPMTPRTRRGASRMMTGMDDFGAEAAAEIERKFRARFD